MSLTKLIEISYQKLLSEQTKEKSERVILSIAIVSFIIHLVLIYLVNWQVISLNAPSDLIGNPIAAIYTPFSFILLYEVYLLIYYLPKSFSIYISKQYEIITLIVIRRLFKDLSNLTLSTDWFSIKYDLQFTFDLVTSIVLFFLIYLFYRQSKTRYAYVVNRKNHHAALSRFIKVKQVLATFLVPVFVGLSIYSFVNWALGSVLGASDSTATSFNNINNIFFEEFFNILIFSDVLLLLSSFFLTDEFHKVVRNSGFVISTILIRVSFVASGLLNNVLIVCAVIFGLLIMLIHNKFEEEINSETSQAS